MEISCLAGLCPVKVLTPPWTPEISTASTKATRNKNSTERKRVNRFAMAGGSKMLAGGWRMEASRRQTKLMWTTFF